VVVLDPDVDVFDVVASAMAAPPTAAAPTAAPVARIDLMFLTGVSFEVVGQESAILRSPHESSA
jgi:hypothetical protein